jgi:hypothetical protein
MRLAWLIDLTAENSELKSGKRCAKRCSRRYFSFTIWPLFGQYYEVNPNFLFQRALRPALLFLFASMCFSTSAVAQQVWSGYTLTFTKGAGTSDTLPQNQDAIFPDVTLTRGSRGGLINIALESSYSSGSSPSGTEWATGLMAANSGQTIDAANWQQLTFTDWIDAFGGAHTGGSSIANTPAVVYLPSENVYLDLEFTSWTSGDSGGYSYERAVAPVPEPSSALLVSAGLALWLVLRRPRSCRAG